MAPWAAARESCCQRADYRGMQVLDHAIDDTHPSTVSLAGSGTFRQRKEPGWSLYPLATPLVLTPGLGLPAEGHGTDGGATFTTASTPHSERRKTHPRSGVSAVAVDRYVRKITLAISNSTRERREAHTPTKD